MPTSVIQAVRSDEAYPLAELRRMGLGEFTVRQMRHRGLKVRRVGRLHFVLGKDLLGFIESAGEIVS